jgi:hypothetical protein
MSDYRRGFGLEIGFINHVHTTLSYNAIADFHILKITAEYAKSFQPAFTSRFPGNGS